MYVIFWFCRKEIISHENWNENKKTRNTLTEGEEQNKIKYCALQWKLGNKRRLLKREKKPQFCEVNDMHNNKYMRKLRCTSCVLGRRKKTVFGSDIIQTNYVIRIDVSTRTFNDCECMYVIHIVHFADTTHHSYIRTAHNTNTARVCCVLFIIIFIIAAQCLSNCAILGTKQVIKSLTSATTT